MNNRFYFRIVAATFAVATFAAFVYLAAGRSSAGPPEYFLTVSESEFDHLSAAGDLEIPVIERRGGISIVRADEAELLVLTGKMHDGFHKCAGFIRHSTLEDARATLEQSLAADTNAVFVNYTIDNQAAVNPMIAEAQETQVRQMILDLSAIPTRRHDQQGGMDGANLILNRWRQIAQGRTDISVQPYAHLDANGNFITQQPSIIMTIQGTEFPNEIIVVGGHQDSINSSGGATATAPGADDDASGIASITEAIRVIKQKNFRPRRTIQFMAYAAEEIGLVGSKNIADNYRAQNKNVIGVLQLDMTNFKGPSADIAMITDNTNAAQNQFLRSLVTTYQPSLVVIDSACGYACSDHASWTNRQYPASMPFEAKYPSEYNTNIHRTTDTIDRSGGNANHALKFSKLAISFVAELAKGSIQMPLVPRTSFDFDADGRSDMSIFRPSDAYWHLNRSTAGYTAMKFGIQTDRPTPADYDNDGKTDMSVYRDGVWHMMRSSEGYTALTFGLPGDIVQPGDFDGDGKADQAVFRPSTGVWYVLKSTGGFTANQFGLSGDKPVAADYDGDGRMDPAVFRGGVWHILGSTVGYRSYQFGIATDVPVVADFDLDAKADAGVFRDGTWYVLRSGGGITIQNWGIAGDIPSPADFDGDGKADAAVFRNGTWYILNSSNGQVRIEQFGLAGDKPVQSSFLQ